MGKSSLVGVDRAPAIPKGRDIDAQGPSDSSDSGSDIQGELDLGAEELGLPQDLPLHIERSGDTDSAGTGERATAMLDEPAVDGADIGVDRITTAPDSDTEVSAEPELEGLAELAEASPEDEEGDEEEAPREDSERVPVRPVRSATTVRTTKPRRKQRR